QGLRRIPRRHRLHPQAVRDGAAPRRRRARPGRREAARGRRGQTRVNAPITPAASVLLAAAPGSREVFLVWRSPALRFMGGFVACPGGKTHDADAPLVDAASGVSLQLLGAVRELFEETGVLLARCEDGSFPPSSDEMSRLRNDLLENRIT